MTTLISNATAYAITAIIYGVPCLSLAFCAVYLGMYFAGYEVK